MDQFIVVVIVAATIYLLFKNKWRYDVVAFSALLVLALISVVPIQDVLFGFSHPALFLVISILILSQGLANSGFVSLISFWLYKIRSYPLLQLFILILCAVAISSFINNSGALALLLPVAIKIAHNSKKPTSFFLIPLAFSTLLGGLMTLTGTPSNIIVSSFRNELVGTGFGYFEFAFLGLPIALIGIVYLLFFGRHLLPKGKDNESNPVEIEYVTELLVPRQTVDKPIPVKQLERALTEGATIIAIHRDDIRLDSHGAIKVHAGDIITLRGNLDATKTFIDNTKTVPLGSRYFLTSTHNDLTAIEAVVVAHSKINGHSAKDIRLFDNHQAGLVAIAHRQEPIKGRLNDVMLHAGDTILLYTHKDKTDDVLNSLQILPLEERNLRITHPRKILLAISIVAAAIVLTITNIVPTALAFLLAVFAMGITNLITIDEAYKSVDWPSIVMLGSMISLVHILENVGIFETFSSALMTVPQFVTPIVMIMSILVVAIILTNIIDNTAVAVLMSPVVVQIGNSLGGPIDAYLMAIALGGIAAFMTPFGEHPNLLVMKPGGYTFQDYWRVGLPLTLIIIATGVPLIMYLWG